LLLPVLVADRHQAGHLDLGQLDLLAAEFGVGQIALFDNDVVVLSANVTNYSFDQFAGLAAFDQMAVANKG